MTYSNTERIADAPKLAAIRVVFTALFDAVDVAGEFDEGRWEDLMAAFNATGRLVFGWPHLESSESDIFGALDDIAVQLEGTKTAITATATDARIVLHELHKALDPLLPEDEPEPSASETNRHDVGLQPTIRHDPQANALESPADHSADSQANDSLAVAVPSRVEDAPSRVGRGADEPSGSEPVQPSIEDLAMFEAVRSGAAETYADIDRVVGLASSRAYQRFQLLERYGTLPTDMQKWRADRRGMVGKRGKTKTDHSPPSQNVPLAVGDEEESFEERRARFAREKANQEMADRRKPPAADHPWKRSMMTPSDPIRATIVR